jgi:subtilisin family serine protease
MKKVKTNLLIAVFLATALSAFSVSPKDSLKYVNWQNKDPKADKAMGVSVEKAYHELLQGKTSKTIIVGVLDSGVDIEHEDLKDIIWINEDEIPGNGIDDDNNGYIDDVHGWNFLGNANGNNIDAATLEVTRLYRRYKEMFVDMEEEEIEKSDKVDYEYYKKVVETFEAKQFAAQASLSGFQETIKNYHEYDSIVKALLVSETYTVKDLKSLKVEKKSKQDTARRFMAAAVSQGFDQARLDEIEDYLENRLNSHYNLDFYSRAVVGDDEYEWTDTAYGNADVVGGDPSHGTMVSGVIGALRNNGIGVNGVADNVKIMVIRTVPDGDEWDKDVANAIKYAIDNGADIINMSFGKSFSPQKEFVDNVVALADEANVLLIHAAGNDGKNLDTEDNFPNRYNTEEEVLANNWLTVGASTITTKKKALAANFSNYGKTKVDVFAPGHNMLMCAPGSAYEFANGTSFAAPTVSGIAALIMSYYPELTAAEVKEIIMESSVKKDYSVKLPGSPYNSKDYVYFSTLSVTGGLANVYEALKLAEEKSNK